MTEQLNFLDNMAALRAVTLAKIPGFDWLYSVNSGSSYYGIFGMTSRREWVFTYLHRGLHQRKSYRMDSDTNARVVIAQILNQHHRYG